MLWFNDFFSLFSRLLKPRTLIHVGTSWPKLTLMVFDMSLTSRKALKTKTTFQIEYFNFYEIQPIIILGTKLLCWIIFNLFPCGQKKINLYCSLLLIRSLKTELQFLLMNSNCRCLLEISFVTISCQKMIYLYQKLVVYERF